MVIAITGSVGKTTTKDMIADILRGAGLSVRSSRKSYNSEFGVPLSIFGLSSGMRNPFIWLYNLCVAFFKMLFAMPQYLVLEVGLENPGDIAGIVKWLKPDIALLTRLAMNPVHLENFPDKKLLYEEKILLLQSVKREGIALYNKEDDVQRAYINQVPDTVVLRSFNSDIIALKETGIYHEGSVPVGSKVVLSMGGKDEPFYIPDTLGVGAVQSLVAAVSVVRCLPDAIPVPAIRKAIASRRPTPGRMCVLAGHNNSVVIDDSYNASPIAVEGAVNTLAMVRRQKKIIVLGVMAELGDNSAEIHRKMGGMVSAIATRVYIVGDGEYGNAENIVYGKSIEEIIRDCRDVADADTVFLCKGSQVARVERVVEGLLASEVNPQAVLVRQETHWRQ